MNYLPDQFRSLSEFQQIASFVWVILVFIIIIVLIFIRPLLSFFREAKIKQMSEGNSSRNKKDKINIRGKSKGF